MGTHYGTCLVCGAGTNCNQPAHCVGVGGNCWNEPGPKIEFCSLECFLELSARMWERFRIAEIVAWNGDL